MVSSIKVELFLKVQKSVQGFGFWAKYLPGFTVGICCPGSCVLRVGPLPAVCLSGISAFWPSGVFCLRALSRTVLTLLLFKVALYACFAVSAQNIGQVLPGLVICRICQHHYANGSECLQVQFNGFGAQMPLTGVEPCQAGADFFRGSGQAVQQHGSYIQAHGARRGSVHTASCRFHGRSVISLHGAG